MVMLVGSSFVYVFLSILSFTVVLSDQSGGISYGSMQGKMYSLLREENVYEVRNVKYNLEEQPNKIQLCTNGSRSLLKKIAHNLNQNIPRVVLGKTTRNHVKRRPFDADTGSTPSRPANYENDFDKEINNSEKGLKKYCCLYCAKLVCQLPRHFLQLHGDEEEIKKLKILPKGCPERVELLTKLRNKGNFQYNTNQDSEHAEKSVLLVCRRPQKKKFKPATDYECCSKCLGYFSRQALRKHYRRCVPDSKKGQRNVIMLGRARRGSAHPKACDVLRFKVLPVLRDDDISKLIRYDELITVYGNKMCRKYRSPHHFKMMRARLRLIGRFLKEMKQIDSNVHELASVFAPPKYDNVLEAIHRCAQYDEETCRFKTPAVAFNLGTDIKHIGQLLVAECIKNENKSKKKEVQDFLVLMKDDYGASINKTVQENQYEKKRNKKIDLPLMEDIKCLNNFLNEKRKKLFSDLTSKFSFNCWKELGEVTLTSIQIFNRRRAGEIERTLLSDIENIQGVDDNINADIFNSLTEPMKERARNFVRYLIRGKLNRTVPVLLSQDLLKSINLLVSLRKQAKISTKNNYLFALPGDDKNRHLEACALMRKFAKKCGAKMPSLLRGTLLRKHVATYSVFLNLEEGDRADLANYMGHSEKIHKEYYKIPSVARDITNMSRLLSLAQGFGEDSLSFDTMAEAIDQEMTFDSSCHGNPTETESQIGLNEELDYPPDENNDCSRVHMKSITVNPTRIENDNLIAATSSLICIDPPSTPPLVQEVENLTSYAYNDPSLHGELDYSLDENDDCSRPAMIENDNLIATTSSLTCTDPPSTPPLVQEGDNLTATTSYTDRDPSLTPEEPYQASESEYIPSDVSNEETKEHKLRVKRKIWSSAERKIVNVVFAAHLKSLTLPTTVECYNCIFKYPELRGRTIKTLKAYINNLNKKTLKKNQKEGTPTKKRKIVTSWETPEKSLLKRVFSHHLENGTLPSLMDCQKVIDKNPILSRRNKTVVKAWINNENNRNIIKNNLRKRKLF